MRYLTTAAMALALAASAAAASADTPDNNNNKGDHAGSHTGAQGGQGSHGGGPPAVGARGVAPGPVHTGGQPGATGQVHTFTGPAGATVQGGGQPAGPGSPNYHAYSRGPVGAPNGQGAPVGQVGQPQFHGGNGVPSGAASGQVHGHFNGGPVGGQAQGGGQFHAGPAPGANFAIRGGIPGSNRALRGRDQGRGWYNPGRFPEQFHAERRFHVGWNNRPHGWYQHTWGFGDFLPFGWFAPEFYLDFQDYGLPYPPVGCEWVREGPDAVLVNVWTGEVLSVAYGVFW